MAEKKTMRVRYLGDDKPEAGSYGSYDFKVNDGVATVPVEVGEAMTTSQPFMWADAGESETEVKKRLKAQEHLAEQQGEITRRAFEATSAPPGERSGGRETKEA